MSSLSEVRTSEFENALSPMVLKSFQITHLGLMLGVIAFTAVVFVVYSTGSVDDTGNDLLDLLNRLSLVHLFFAIAAYAMAAFIYKSRLRSDRVMGGGQGDVGGQGGSSLVEKCISVIRTTLLIR